MCKSFECFFSFSSEPKPVESPKAPKIKPEVKPEIKVEVQPEIKEEVKPEIKVEVKPEIKVEVQPEIKQEATQSKEVETSLPSKAETLVPTAFELSEEPIVTVTIEKEKTSLKKEPKVTVSEDKVQTADVETFESDFVPEVSKDTKHVAKSQASLIMNVRKGSLKTQKEADDIVKVSDAPKAKQDTDSEKNIVGENGIKSTENTDSSKESSTEEDNSSSLSDIINDVANVKALASGSNEESDNKHNTPQEITEPRVDNTAKGVESADKKEIASNSLQHNKDIVVDVNSNIPNETKVAKDVLDTVHEVDTKVEFKELPPPTAACIEIEKPKLVNKFKSGEIRRTQSTRAPGSEKPEWLQVKLRKVGSKQTPFVIPEKTVASVKPEILVSSTSSVKPQDTVKVTEAEPVVKVSDTKTDTVSASTLLECRPRELTLTESRPREIKLSRSQSARVTDRSTPGALKDSTNSPLNYPKKEPIKLTPVSERARIFQMNEASTPTGKQSPVDIISKAINLSRAESMKAPVGHRFTSVQRSSSFRTPDSTEKGNVTLELSPQSTKVGCVPCYQIFMQS